METTPRGDVLDVGLSFYLLNNRVLLKEEMEVGMNGVNWRNNYHSYVYMITGEWCKVASNGMMYVGYGSFRFVVC